VLKRFNFSFLLFCFVLFCFVLFYFLFFCFLFFSFLFFSCPFLSYKAYSRSGVDALFILDALQFYFMEAVMLTRT